MGQRVHQGHVAINAYQHEEVDAAVGVHVDGEGDHCAQGIGKGPVESFGRVHSPEGHESHEDEVSGGHVAQEDLSHGAGLLMKAENPQYKHIEEDSQHRDDQDVMWQHSRVPFVFFCMRAMSCICLVLGSIHNRSAEVSRGAV